MGEHNIASVGSERGWLMPICVNLAQAITAPILAAAAR